MLHALVAEDQGTVASTTETLSQAVFGPVPLIHGLIAPDGMALCYPDYSTHRGEPGLCIQDLYVSPTARGTGLARALFAATLQHQTWGANYISRSTARRRALGKSPSPRNHSSRRPQPGAQAGAQAGARVAACACKPAQSHPSDTGEPLSHCLNQWRNGLTPRQLQGPRQAPDTLAVPQPASPDLPNRFHAEHASCSRPKTGVLHDWGGQFWTLFHPVSWSLLHAVLHTASPATAPDRATRAAWAGSMFKSASTTPPGSR